MPNGRRNGVLVPTGLVNLGVCASLSALAILALISTIFFGIYVFKYDHNHSHHSIKQSVITDASGVVLGTDSFGNCQNDVEISQYRLVRIGHTITAYVQGTCRNTSDTVDTELDIDLNFGAFSEVYRCPTGDSNDDSAVVGTGSAIVQGSNVSANLQIEANTDADEVDVDIEFSNSVAEGSDVTFSVVFNYAADNC